MQTITGFDEKLATIFVKLFTGTGDLRSNLLSAKCWLRSLVVKACRSCRDMGKSGLAGQQCPLLAQSGHLNTRYQYPLSGVKRTVVGDAAMSASLIGRLGSSAFRLSITAVSMSLAGSCFSTDSALGPFHHGIRGQGGTIF